MSWIECPKCGVLYRGEHTCAKKEATATEEKLRLPVELEAWEKRMVRAEIEIDKAITEARVKNQLLMANIPTLLKRLMQKYARYETEEHSSESVKRVFLSPLEFIARSEMEVLDFLRAFEIDINMDDWLRLYLEASKSLGKVLGEPTATHLWVKFRDMGLLRMWALLDKDNREIIVQMLKIWKKEK